MSPTPSWRPSPEPGPAQEPERRGCMGGWIALLKRQPKPENSWSLRGSVETSVLIAIVGALNQMEWPAFGWVVLPLTVAGFYFSWRRRALSNWIVKGLLSILMLVVLGNFLLGLAANPYDPRLPLAELLLWLQTLHSFDLPARKDLKYSLLVGLVLISFGAVLSENLSYALYLTTFLGSALWTLHLCYLSEAREVPEAAQAGVARLKGNPGASLRAAPAFMVRLTARTAGLTLLASALTFTLLPRYESLRLQGLPVSWNMRLSLPKLGTGEVINPSYPAGMPQKPGSRAFNPDNYAGFDTVVDLSLRGTLSDEVVMKVRSNRWSYYRGLAYTNYDGNFWTLSEERPRKVHSSMPPIILPLKMDPDGTQQQIQIFRIERELPNVVFGPYQPFQVFFPSEDLYVDQSLGIRAPFPLEEGMIYSVLGLSRSMKPAELKALPPVERYPRLARSLNVRLPEAVPPRVRELARTLTGRYRSPYEKACALALHLQNRYAYENPAPPYPRGAEVSDYFLFEARKGNCEEFATAMVVMARAVGLPARYVTGYLPGNYNPFTGYYEVRGGEAHAWAEVYLPGYDWMAFDPTPAGGGTLVPGLEQHQQQHWMLGALLKYLGNLVPQRQREAALRSWSEVRNTVARGFLALGRLGLPTPVALLLLAPVVLSLPLGLAALALRRARRTGRWSPLTHSLDRAFRALGSLLPQPPQTPREHVLATWHGMVRVLEGLGLHRREGETPREFARAVREQRGWPEVESLTGLFEEARYGSAEPPEEAQARAAEALETLRQRVREEASREA